MMDIKKYLPLGSIVKLEGMDDNIMIMGYMPYGELDGKSISGDYSGVKVNEGYNYENSIVFNKEHISNVIFMGYKNMEIINRLKCCDIMLDTIKNSKKDDNVADEIVAKIINSNTNSEIVKETKSVIEEDLNE
jgi:hypothetical protein